MDELRFRAQQSPRNEPPMASFVSPPRNGNGARLPQQAAHDQRANMPRRFTTDSGRVPTLSSMNSSMSSPQRGTGLDANPEYNVGSRPRLDGPQASSGHSSMLANCQSRSRRYTKSNWYVAQMQMSNPCHAAGRPYDLPPKQSEARVTGPGADPDHR